MAKHQPIVFSPKTRLYIKEHNDAIEAAVNRAKLAIRAAPELRLMIMKDYKREAHQADMIYEQKMASRLRST